MGKLLMHENRVLLLLMLDIPCWKLCNELYKNKYITFPDAEKRSTNRDLILN